MSVVILEAMAARCSPIVATSVGQNAAVLADGESDILVPPKDAGTLARGLARAVEDVSLRTRLADTAYAAYVRDFTGRAMADRHVATYRECLESRGLGPVH